MCKTGDEKKPEKRRGKDKSKGKGDGLGSRFSSVFCVKEALGKSWCLFFSFVRRWFGTVTAEFTFFSHLHEGVGQRVQLYPPT
jgi:hypothetical protein